MTLAPSTLARSAVELRDDDGAPVATIYARESGVEIVATAAITFETHTDAPGRVGVTLTRDAEARRR